MSTPDLEPFREWMMGRGRSAGTANLYSTQVRLCYGHKPLSSRLLARNLSPSTKRTILAALRAFGKWRRDDKLLAELSDLKLPSPARVIEKKPLSREEWDHIVDAVEYLEDQDFRAAVRMICVRGFRVGDVCRMTKRQIERAQSEEILVYEAKAGRYLRWSTALYEESLAELLATRNWTRVSDLLAPGSSQETRQRAARLNVSRKFRQLETTAGLELGSVTPHRMRRTYAVAFLKACGGDLAALQQHMGWASLNTALKYVDHVRAEELDAISLEMRRKK